jgi:hypothetical protein
MGQLPDPPFPCRLVFRLVFLLVALDRTAWGLGGLFRPDDLFAFLRAPGTPTPDQVLFWKVQSGLALVHALVFVILVWRPGEFGPLVLVPLFGLALATGVWLWTAGTDRLALPSRWPCLILAAHDAVWLPPLAGFLAAWQRRRRSPT